MQRDILREQIDYYRARAQEYDESIFATGRYANDLQVLDIARETLDTYALRLVQSLEPCEQILELACGTGIWTRALLTIGRYITALDASPEMLEINRGKLNDPRIYYQQVDLFAWEPERTYDLVFFASWLSHVPPDQLDLFLAKVRRAANPGGRVVIFDEYAPMQEDLQMARDGIYHKRPLYDGRTFTIIKVYYDLAELRTKLENFGFAVDIQKLDDNFFFLIAM
jgi:ubiquinone/menaquinone biosynthesis C-methylase UbiE